MLSSISKVKKLKAKRSICVFTGSRAEFGLLLPIIKRIHSSKQTELQLVVTGSHLSPQFGSTIEEIEGEGLPVTARVDCIKGTDGAAEINQSFGHATMKFSEVLERLKPDLMVVLGDRYEMLAAVVSALFRRIPVAHISGGEKTSGAYDDAIRHSITKMSHFHLLRQKNMRGE